MALGEFELIDRYFTRRRAPREGVAMGIGDDCALLSPAPGMQLALSTDTLVEGRHFLSTVDPRRLGHKTLAVNLSDLAAAGARPLAFMLALTLPSADERFLERFSEGLLSLADAHSIELVGGDTTSGPLSITITVLGELPTGAALGRGGASAGDDLWVSGTLGDARLALEAFRGTVELPGTALSVVRDALELPQPRVVLGQALRGIASAAIDVSDGLLGDLGHILDRSSGEQRLGASVDASRLPRSGTLASMPEALQLKCMLAGGDDYELLFTAPPGRADAVLAAGQRSGTRVTRIGSIGSDPDVRVLDAGGRALEGRWASFDHFRT